jgi:hypothetical protein
VLKVDFMSTDYSHSRNQIQDFSVWGLAYSFVMPPRRRFVYVNGISKEKLCDELSLSAFLLRQCWRCFGPFTLNHHLSVHRNSSSFARPLPAAVSLGTQCFLPGPLREIPSIRFRL